MGGRVGGHPPLGTVLDTSPFLRARQHPSGGPRHRRGPRLSPSALTRYVVTLTGLPYYRLGSSFLNSSESRVGVYFPSGSRWVPLDSTPFPYSPEAFPGLPPVSESLPLPGCGVVALGLLLGSGILVRVQPYIRELGVVGGPAPFGGPVSLG